METIEIIEKHKFTWRDDGKDISYYTGVIKELNGSEICRHVGFVFSRYIGDNIVAIDSINSVSCIFHDEKLSIEQLNEGRSYAVEINRTKPLNPEIMTVSLLETALIKSYE